MRSGEGAPLTDTRQILSRSHPRGLRLISRDGVILSTEGTQPQFITEGLLVGVIKERIHQNSEVEVGEEHPLPSLGADIDKLKDKNTGVMIDSLNKAMKRAQRQTDSGDIEGSYRNLDSVSFLSHPNKVEGPDPLYLETRSFARRQKRLVIYAKELVDRGRKELDNALTEGEKLRGLEKAHKNAHVANKYNPRRYGVGRQERFISNNSGVDIEMPDDEEGDVEDDSAVEMKLVGLSTQSPDFKNPVMLDFISTGTRRALSRYVEKSMVEYNRAAAKALDILEGKA